MRRLMRRFGVAGTLAVVIAVTASASLGARQGGAALEESIPAGENFDKADFKLWLPDGQGAIRAILVLVPGSNGDGRPMADDPVWQAFATKHLLALVACGDRMCP